jgi:hypothetical protein
MRVTPIRGAGAALLWCPQCRLMCRPPALRRRNRCPRCQHPRLLRLASLRGDIRRAQP